MLRHTLTRVNFTCLIKHIFEQDKKKKSNALHWTHGHLDTI